MNAGVRFRRRYLARQDIVFWTGYLPTEAGKPNGAWDRFVCGAVIAHHAAANPEGLSGSVQRGSVVKLFNKICHPEVAYFYHFLPDYSGFAPPPVLYEGTFVPGTVLFGLD